MTTLDRLLVLLLGLFWCGGVHAQVCNGSFGDPVVNIDFDRGSAMYGSRIAETNYTYIIGTPNDGQYTIAKSTAGTYSTWHQNVFNHTPNDPNGYFMIVNASYTQGIFYEKTIDVCANTTYQFSAFIINLLRNTGLKPNVKFWIFYGSNSVTATTNNIPEGSATDWKEYKLLFTVPSNVSTITLRMTNENSGGIGNDVGIDDITFKACGPLISSTLKGQVSNQVSTCEGEPFELNAVVPAGYENPAYVYQWQIYKGGSWAHILNENNLGMQGDLTGAVPGVYRYRMLVTAAQNVGSATCGVASMESTITIRGKPVIQANSVKGCLGVPVSLTVNAAATYRWKGPNGNDVSDLQTYTLQNPTLADGGIYTIEITDGFGCKNFTSVSLSIEPRVTAAVNLDEQLICEGESIALVASGGSQYQWFPSSGLSDDKIANPIATPSETTVYRVEVSNGGACVDNKEVVVRVNKKARANAGPDKKILAKEHIALEGMAGGDDVSYYWTPADDLDNPLSLHPNASPLKTTTYTLHVVSNKGCNVSTDEVEVMVYPKIEFPNTFTPNGDGVNDTWEIPFLGQFPKAKLQIFNRGGAKVFEGDGRKSWDGRLNGKEMPVASYYYTLYLSDEYRIYSGWLLLVR